LRPATEQMQLFLVGFMGCGKTTVGRLVAGALDWKFVDLDIAIESRAGQDIESIFTEHGEIGFRRMESDALRMVVEQPNTVVATGGGIMTMSGNVTTMSGAGKSVWLDLPFADIIARLGEQQRRLRPLWRDDRVAKDLYRNRLSGYRAADIRVAVSVDETPEQTAERVVDLLRIEE